MEPSPESPVAIRRRLDVLEIDGGWISPEVPRPEWPWMWCDWVVVQWAWWALSYMLQRLRPKPVLRFAPGRVTIVRGCREQSFAAEHVGVHATAFETQLTARHQSGFETLLPGPRLLPLEVAELAEILDAHVHVEERPGYR